MHRAGVIVAGALTFLGAEGLAVAAEAKVLTMKECRASFRTAKAAGDLPRTTWKEFRRAHTCTTKSSVRRS
jgi:hypothetical protein